MTFIQVGICSILVGILPSCGPEDSSSLDDGKSDGKGVVIGDGACATITTEVGNVKLSDLKDPAAKALFASGECPTTFSATAKKLHQASGKVDYNLCTNSMVVSEDSQNNERPGQYRVVTTQDCLEQQVFMSVFASQGATVQDIDGGTLEMLAFDESSGVFNFYDLRGGQWNFVGNSEHMRNGGRCGACHNSGGMVMKELHSPWIYWEEVLETPGLTGPEGLFATTRDPAITTANPETEAMEPASIFGNHDTIGGSTMEGNTHVENLAYVTAKVAQLAKELQSGGDADVVKELLRPAFCTTEFNMDSLGQAIDLEIDGQDSELFLELDPLIDPRFSCSEFEGKFDCFFDNVSIEGVSLKARAKDYLQYLTTTKSKVPGSGKPDTALPQAWIERGDIDSIWVDQLVQQQIIDANTALAIVATDGTRSIFSKERCALLDKVAGKVSVSGKLVDNMWSMLVANTQALPESKRPGTIEADFARSLMLNAAQNTTRITRFLQTCQARDSKAFLSDYMKIIDINREEALTHEVMEAKSLLLPTDNVSVSHDSRLGWGTCELKDSYASAAFDCASNAGAPGVCIDTQTTTCGGQKVSGKCQGPDRVVCCVQ